MIRKLAIGAAVVIAPIALIALVAFHSRNPDRTAVPAPLVTPTSASSPPIEPVPAAAAPPPVVGSPSGDARAERLRTLESRALETLPTIAQVRQKTNEEVHATPPEILESGRRLGELAEYLSRNPDLVRSALPTYVRCAEDAAVATGTRALCAFRLHVYEKDWDDATRASYAKLPAQVRSIARQLEGSE